MFVLLFGVGVALMMGIATEFFRVISRIVSIVSSGVIFAVLTGTDFRPWKAINLLK